MNKTETIRILIAENHELMGEALANLLARNRRFEVVGRVSNGQAALDFIANNPGKVDVALLDLLMEEKRGLMPDGLRTGLEIIQLYPPSKGHEIKIIIISMLIQGLYISQAFLNGLDGYLPKESPPGKLNEAIENVMLGKRHYGSLVMENMNTYIRENRAHLDTVELTSTELRVLELVAFGHATKSIAAETKTKISTIDTHRKNIMEKFRANNAAHMVSLAYQKGFLTVK